MDIVEHLFVGVIAFGSVFIGIHLLFKATGAVADVVDKIKTKNKK